MTIKDYISWEAIDQKLEIARQTAADLDVIMERLGITMEDIYKHE